MYQLLLLIHSLALVRAKEILHTATCRYDTMYLKTIFLLGFPTCFQWRGEHPNGSEPGNKPEDGKNKCTYVY